MAILVSKISFISKQDSGVFKVSGPVIYITGNMEEMEELKLLRNQQKKYLRGKMINVAYLTFIAYFVDLNIIINSIFLYEQVQKVY